MQEDNKLNLPSEWYLKYPKIKDPLFNFTSNLAKWDQVYRRMLGPLEKIQMIATFNGLLQHFQKIDQITKQLFKLLDEMEKAGVITQVTTLIEDAGELDNFVNEIIENTKYVFCNSITFEAKLEYAKFVVKTLCEKLLLLPIGDFHRYFPNKKVFWDWMFRQVIKRIETYWVFVLAEKLLNAKITFYLSSLDDIDIELEKLTEKNQKVPFLGEYTFLASESPEKIAFTTQYKYVPGWGFVRLEEIEEILELLDKMKRFLEKLPREDKDLWIDYLTTNKEKKEAFLSVRRSDRATRRARKILKENYEEFSNLVKFIKTLNNSNEFKMLIKTNLARVNGNKIV